MTNLSRSISGKRVDATAYYAFRGMDRSRDRTNMETKEEQHWWELHNCYANYRGRIIRDAALFPIHKGTQAVAVNFYSIRDLLWAARDQAAISLVADNGEIVTDAYLRNSNVSMSRFNGRTLICAQDQQIYRFDGNKFYFSAATIKPAFMVPIQRRVAAAGFIDRPTVVEFSRVDNDEVFLAQEGDSTLEDDSDVTRAAFIDIANLINSADQITGLGAFEANRLAIFTQDQVLVYFIDPDFNQWSLDTRANIQVGCVSHATIQQAGSDLLFCSRVGVHSLIRSEANGLTLAESVLSDDVEELYKELVKSVDDPQSISAVYDQDFQVYHIFFPQRGGIVTRRLSLHFRNGYQINNFSTGDSLYARCGTFLGGRLILGTRDGLYEGYDRVFRQDNVPTTALSRGDMRAKTPILWLGDFVNNKTSDSIIIQAFGQGRFFIDAYDEEDNLMETLEVELDQIEGVEDVPAQTLSKDFQFPFFHTFRGLQLVFRNDPGDALSSFNLTSFAILAEKG